MPASAPSATAALTRSSAPAAAMTFAPRYFATWIPAVPRPPDAPITSTQSLDCSPAMSRSMLKATGAWRATTVAAAKSTPSGIGCVHATGTFTYCAYPPQTCRPSMTGNEFAAGGRTNCSVTTRSPGLRALTPGPTAATTPDGSTPSTCGSLIGTAYAPARTTRSSVRFTDTARTSISTSPACGTGVGTSSSRITSGGPNSRMTIAFMAPALRDRVGDEFLRNRLAPLRAQSFLRRKQLGAMARVEHVGVSPVLVHPAPRILPVVVDLAAEDVAPDAPHVLVLAGLAQVLVAEHDVVDALHFERKMIQPRLRPFEAQEHVVIDESLAAVAAVERGDDVVLRAGVDVVRGEQAEHLAVPLDSLFCVLRHDHAVGDALHLRRAALEAHELAGAPQFAVAPVEHVLARRQAFELLHPGNHFHLVAVRVVDAHALAPARLVEVLDAGGAGRLGELFQIAFVVDEKGQADEFRRPEVGYVQVVGGIGAAHVQRARGPLGADHAEAGEELLGFIEAGRLQPSIGEVGDFHERHRRSPLASVLMQILAPH